MKRGDYCPVCTTVWVRAHRLRGLETCPNCEGVLLVLVKDWDGDGKWVR